MKPTIEALTLLQEGSLVFAEMEAAGIRIDMPYLNNTIKEVTQRIRNLEISLRASEVYKLWLKRFKYKTKLGSLQQLGEILFKVMKYPCHALTPTKRPKTDEESLKRVDHPFVRDYMLLGDLKKDKSTYLEGIRNEVVDGYIHPFFSLHTAVSYRSSSSDPNFHNFPNRDPVRMKMVRQCFIPREGNHLVEFDFSGVEVRVACCYTKDPQLIKEFTGPGGDPHGQTAMELFGLKKEQVQKGSTRHWAKNRFVFAQFYGSVYFQCAPHLWEVASDEQYKLADGTTILEHLKSQGIKELGDCTPNANVSSSTFVHRVKQVENSFWNDRFKVYSSWKNRWWNAYIRNGEFVTLTGFRCQWGKAGPLSRNDALNYPIQGSAFHCLLWTLIQVQKWLRKNQMKCRIIGQIHDSLVLDCPPDELQAVLNKIYQTITVDIRNHWSWVIVPLDAEAEVAPVNASWDKKAQWVPNAKGIWTLKEK